MCVKVELYTIDYIIHSHNNALIIMILSTRFLYTFLRNLLSNNTKHIKKQSTLSRGCFFIALYTIHTNGYAPTSTQNMFLYILASLKKSITYYPKIQYFLAVW